MKAVFTTTSHSLRRFSGETVDVLSTSTHRGMKMYRVRANEGAFFTAFSDELKYI